MLDAVLEQYPKEISLKDGFKPTLRPLKPSDEKAFHDFFLAVPEQERMFIKHRVTDSEVIGDWCRNIDLGRNLPLLALAGSKIIGDATLHGGRRPDAAPSALGEQGRKSGAEDRRRRPVRRVGGTSAQRGAGRGVPGLHGRTKTVGKDGRRWRQSSP